MLPILAAALASVVAGAFGAYRVGGVRKAASRARNAEHKAARTLRDTEEILESREKALKESSRRYVDGRVKERLREVSVDVLRKQTGKRVKVKPLEDAGLNTVGDLVGKSTAELRSVRGIGLVSARALHQAVKGYVETARGTAPPLPDPALEDAAAQAVARDALVFLDAFRRLGGAPQRMRGALEEIRERHGNAAEEATFLRWLGRTLKGGLNRRHEERLKALAADLEGLEAHEAFAAEARTELRGTAVPAEAVGDRFRAEYADCCALLERVFAELDLELGVERTRAPKPGAAPAETEIARRVEAAGLRTDGLKVMLRRYQAFGARYVLVQRRTVLGDEMGLGKTIQALAAAVHLGHEQEHPYFLVVAPASILGNWIHEIEGRTELKGTLLHGEDFEDDLARWVEAGGFGVTSYTTLRRNVIELDHKGPPRLSLLIADEAHYAKNPSAQRTVALVRLADRAERVCFMTGTPLENHPEEFVHLLGSLAPDRARDLRAFLKQPGSVLGGAKHFHAEVADVYLRRNQEDVLKELPERIDKEEWIDLNGPERAAYREMVEAGNFMGMRRAVTLGDDVEPSAKFERLGDLLEEYRESGVKVLLFSYFLDVLAAVEREFGALGAITGSVPPERRFEIVQEFQQADGHHMLLGQIDAAGTGLNLQAAGAVVLMEPQLKPTTEAQAIARAHRMGQTRRVVVHRLLARSSVDERLVELLARKSELFERFARESLVKDASEEATASGLAAALVKAEQERLAGN